MVTFIFFSQNSDDEYEEPKQYTIRPNVLGTTMQKEKTSQVSKKSEPRKCRIPNYKTKAGGAMQMKSPYTRGNSPMQILLPSTPMSGSHYSQSRSRSRSRSISKNSRNQKRVLNENINYDNEAKSKVQPVNRYRTEKYLNNVAGHNQTSER